MSDAPIFEPGPLFDWDPTDPPDVIFFPVRHYSPTSALLLHELVKAVSPTAVLVEGPSEFNDRVDELMLSGHELPIALYTFVRLSDDTKRSAFYPYCDYAPEWQAVQIARDRGIPLRFIDLPWSEMATRTQREHRYSDFHFRRNPYPDVLCSRMNVANFDELWDVLFELDTDLDWQGYMRRCHEFCWHLRVFGGEETEENAAREECMAAHIGKAVDELGGPVVVVTGGYHSSGLWSRLNGYQIEYEELERVELISAVMPGPDDDGGEDDEDSDLDGFDVKLEVVGAPEDEDGPPEPPEIIEAGITLTPFTYERIDKLSGYSSGVHGPAFYQYVYDVRRSGEPLDSREFLYEIVAKLRDKGQVASTADVIGIESTARALATLRGRREIWRFDLLDAISSALVKEAQDGEYMHPVLMLAREVLRGSKRGAVDENAPLPPLVRAARRILEEHDLLPESDGTRRIELDLEDARDLERSRVLHQCRVLQLSGFSFSGGTNFATRDDLSNVWEEWNVEWSPEFEATLIESAVYGADLRDASTARILERAQEVESDAEKAALIAIDAVLMGVNDVAESLYEKLHSIVRGDSDFFNVAAALGHVLYLFRHDEVLGSRGDVELEQLLRETYLRAMWLFESLGTVKDRDAELIESIRVLFQTFQRCYVDDAADRDEFIGIFSRTSADEGQSPLTRGASMGALYSLGELDTDRVLATMKFFRDPMELGDWLIGFFSLAREAAQRDERLVKLLDEIICALSQQEFLEVLPGFRLAFTFFTPMEKHRLVEALFGAGSEHVISVDPRAAAEGAALERRIRDVANAFSLRGVADDLPELPDLGPDERGEGPRGTREEEEPTLQDQPDGAPDGGNRGSSAPPQQPEAMPDLAPERGDDEPADQDSGTSNETDDGGEGPGDSAEDGTGEQSEDGEGDADGQAGAGDEPGPADLTDEERKERWRLIFGTGSEGSLGGLGGDGAKRDRLLAYLYDREYGPGRNVRGRSPERGDRGSLDPSQLTVPEWINGVHELFPKRTVERLEKDALDRYEIEELVTRPDVLSRAKPNPTLLKAVLRTKHLMNNQVLDMARRLVRQTVEELMEKLAREIQQPFTGAMDRRRRSFLKVAKNFDAAETIRRNLKHWSASRNQIVIQDPFFFSRIRRHVDKWQIIIVVDQSGSMLDSVIHAAVTASIFHGLTKLKTHLVAFDTDIVDLTSDARDPVETLMGVQLGGGTDIANALAYARTLVENPARTIVVLVTDFFEGGPIGHLMAETRELVESGVTLLGLAALDEQANPHYDRETAEKMVRLGAHVGAMTPGELAEFVAERVR